MAFFTPDQVRAAVKEHSTIFFNGSLQPVVPREGQWFCEFHICPTDEGMGDEVQDEAIVEYLGPDTKYVMYGSEWQPIHTHSVASEYDESDREPRGDILVLQGGH